MRISRDRPSWHEPAGRKAPVSQTLPRPTFPRPALFMAGGVIAFSILLAVYGRIAGPVGVPPPSTPVITRNLLFRDQGDGGVKVIDAATGRTVEIFPPGSNGFLRATMRGLARNRELQHVGGESPFRLVAWADRRLTLEDPATGRTIELEAFGHTNEAVFASLLGPEQAPATAAAPAAAASPATAASP